MTVNAVLSMDLNIRGCSRFETTDTVCDAEFWFCIRHDLVGP
jgi:hypothetical protein